MPHIHEKIDFTADTFIVHKNRVLLRMHEKYHIWLPPGGHIELHEDPATAAAREVKEEVGIEVKLMDTRLFKEPMHDNSTEVMPPMGMNWHHVTDTHDHISMMYFGTTDNDTVTQGDTEVSPDIRWFTKEELLGTEYDINERVKLYALKALELLGD